ncbi:Flavin-containing monooxygenase FMO GS-OX-like 9 [Triticum urartu]|uniref:Flavin-containing monooxygenase n=1 Tax=Triticum urartu TaxID=4572 RepID=M7YDC7_TRIUA|nr:Flavin-containing monooxygenase FMO GS-OX-like 9 [Triticum urartu]
MEAVRLNTRVLRASMTPARKWAVRSMDLGLGECAGANGKELDAYVDEVFDAVVVATGHYSQPRLPSIKDIAMEIRGVAKEVYIVAGSMEAVTPGLSKVLAKHSANLHLRLEVERLCEDGRVVFKDGGGSSSSIAADTVIYCTGYNYSFPFLDTSGAVAVDDNRVGPLFEHVFPPSLAPSLSFVGLLRKVFAPRSFEAQARWVAQVLSGRRKLPTEEEMLRFVEEFYRAKEIAGVPSKYTHEVGSLKCSYVDDFGEKYCDFPRQERWQYEMLRSTVHDMMDTFETFRDDYQDSVSIGKAVQEWHLSCLHSSSKAGSEVICSSTGGATGHCLMHTPTTHATATATRAAGKQEAHAALPHSSKHLAGHCGCRQDLADDDAIFVKPIKEDIQFLASTLANFGEATSLVQETAADLLFHYRFTFPLLEGGRGGGVRRGGAPRKGGAGGGVL